MKGGLPCDYKDDRWVPILAGCVDGGGVKTRVEPPGVWVTDRETQQPPGWGTKKRDALLADS